MNRPYGQTYRPGGDPAAGRRGRRPLQDDIHARRKSAGGRAKAHPYEQDPTRDKECRGAAFCSRFFRSTPRAIHESPLRANKYARRKSIGGPSGRRPLRTQSDVGKRNERHITMTSPDRFGPGRFFPFGRLRFPPGHGIVFSGRRYETEEST